MVEQYLGKETADDIFFASMLSGLIPEKVACELSVGMQKDAGVFDGIKKIVGAVGGGALEAFKHAPAIISGTALGGAAAGALGATVYDILKERVSHEDPEAELNDNLERLYAYKNREMEDARWMDRVRALRDELKRGYKKMTTEEYAQKYNALMDALNERSA